MKFLGVLLVVGLVSMYFWQIVAVVVVVGMTWWIVRAAADARDFKMAIAGRADEQHQQVLAGDDRGVYGIYTPYEAA